MTPRNTQLGASANARRTPSSRVARVAPSQASRTKPASARSPRALSTAPEKPRVRDRDTSSHRWWLLPLVIVAVLSLFVAGYYPVARVQYRETRERTMLRTQLDAIRARNDRLRDDVARLKTPEGVEDYARLQLGMVKKGEHQVIVVDGTEPTSVAMGKDSERQIDSAEALKPPVGQWTAFLDAVFGVQ